LSVTLAEVEKISCSAFGVRVDVTVPARLHTQARALLPPNAEIVHSGDPGVSVSIDDGDGQLAVIADRTLVGTTQDEELALGMLDAQIRAQIALLAPDHVFVHAGVVAVGDRAVVLPGSTFAGKTTLTRALVEAGATYYSDEFAVIDAAGLVHPYPKPLSIRLADGTGRTTETLAHSLGGATGETPVPIGLIAVTTYRPGARLQPEPLNAGAALLALLGHTIPARTRPKQSLAALKAAVQGAAAWKSDRGEAQATAREILNQLSARRDQ
jgi:hypothetical protein